ncbi:MAG: hypothetical protein LUD78_07445 [Clostridiales bacterium]|nr:hypothetical protein [Clostridiales bacterium]
MAEKSPLCYTATKPSTRGPAPTHNRGGHGYFTAVLPARQERIFTMFFVDTCESIYKIKSGLNAIQGLHQAMVEGGADPSSWMDGLYFVASELQKETDELEKLLDAEYNRRKAEGR